MRRVTGLFIFLFMLTVCGIPPIYAANGSEKAKEETVSKDSFDSYKELTDTKIEAAKESLEKDIQGYATRLDAQDKRIDQQGGRVGDIGLYLTAFGVVLAALALIGGWFGLVTVKSNAKEQARDAAQVWFEEREQHLYQQIEGFKQQVIALQEQVKQQADQHCDVMQDVTDEVKKQAEDHIKTMQEAKQRLQQQGEQKEQPSEASKESTDALSKVVEAIRQKPVCEYTFDDWNKLAFSADEQNQKEDAIYYWRQAIKSPDSNEKDKLKAFFNIARTLWDSERYQNVISICDEIIEQFANSTTPTAQETCLRVLYNKGLALGKMNELTRVVSCYDDLLARYDQSTNQTIQSQCKSALANTVEPLLVLGRNTEAIQRICQVLEQTDNTHQEYAIMTFLLWLAETDTTPQNVLAVIRALSPTVQFTWGWNEIRPLLDKLLEPRKTQAECFIAFFEKHHDIAMLEQCLTAASN